MPPLCVAGGGEKSYTLPFMLFVVVHDASASPLSLLRRHLPASSSSFTFGTKQNGRSTKILDLSTRPI